jgi:hypothetical protein
MSSLRAVDRFPGYFSARLPSILQVTHWQIENRPCLYGPAISNGYEFEIPQIKVKMCFIHIHAANTPLFAHRMFSFTFVENSEKDGTLSLA